MKKAVLGLMMILLVLALTACACKHEETKLINVVESTCTEEGYSGDTFCLKCEKIIVEGQSVEVRPHTESEPTNVREATCTEEGYTGDIYCIECGEKLKEGEPIPALGHTEGALSGAYEPTCSSDGYSGDVYCTICDELLIEGTAIPAIGHNVGELVDCYEPTCYACGYTGDAFCTVCGELVIEGKSIALLEHTPGELQDVVEATCYSEGYTGDTYCTVCGSMVTAGNTIPMVEHTLSEPYDVVEATCIVEGYTGTRDCTVCNEIVYGDTIPKTDHSYVDNICSVCEWRVPGLYVEDELMMTWNQLVEGSYIKMDGSSLIDVSKRLMGMLVVSEDVTEILGNRDMLFGSSSPFYGMEEIESIYLPTGITSLGLHFSRRGTFEGCTKLKEIRTFDTLTDLGGDATFKGCQALREFDVPAGTERIGNNAFNGCISLEKVTIPDTVTYIGEGAFDNTPALTHIDLPKNLKSLGYTFKNSGVSAITLPESVIDISGGGLSYLDASACKWETIGRAAFHSNSNLIGIKLPGTLKAITYGSFYGCDSLESLVLPDGFEYMRDDSEAYSPFDYCDSLTTVVWPVSFLDGTKISPRYCPSIKTIYYRGSEFQWDLTASRDLFDGVNVVFNYEGDGSEFQGW